TPVNLSVALDFISFHPHDLFSLPVCPSALPDDPFSLPVCPSALPDDPFSLPVCPSALPDDPFSLLVCPSVLPASVCPLVLVLTFRPADLISFAVIPLPSSVPPFLILFLSSSTFLYCFYIISSDKYFVNIYQYSLYTYNNQNIHISSKY